MENAARNALIESVSIIRKQCAASRGMSYSDLTENAELIDFVRDDLKDAIMYAEHKSGENLGSLLPAVQAAKNVYDMFAAVEMAIGAKLEDVADLFSFELPENPPENHGRYYVLMMAGADAVKAGNAFQGSKCFRVIRDEDGKYCGQLEVVRDDEEAQLVAVSFIPESKKDFVVSFLADNGFSGLTVFPESYSDRECFDDRKDEESIVIPSPVPAWPDDSTSETLENIHGDLAVIYYWDDSFEYDACRGYEIFPDGEREKGLGMVPCGNADTAYSILSRKGFRY